mmetsp:Transcript_56283/g.136443  ORF Transcript_56283/g.136443 Transcript_56283/m.136443 type:complete len:107 (+) Transcript_56283:2646-2966(+)
MTTIDSLCTQKRPSRKESKAEKLGQAAERTTYYHFFVVDQRRFKAWEDEMFRCCPTNIMTNGRNVINQGNSKLPISAIIEKRQKLWKNEGHNAIQSEEVAQSCHVF